MPKVSIVLPSYNGSAYIKKSIESVINQEYTDWELIIVDDCSTDDTLQIARAYEEKDARIKVHHNETNQKLPESLNVGFRQATGEYLTWTSDDNWLRIKSYFATWSVLALCTGKTLRSPSANMTRLSSWQKIMITGFV